MVIMDRKTSVLMLGAITFFILIFMSGCGAIVRKATRPAIENLKNSVMMQQDLDLVRDGAPAYMLLIDGMAQGNSDNTEMLMAAAQIYSAYCSAFVLGQDGERAKIMSQKAKSYAFAAVAKSHPEFVKNANQPFQKFEPTVQTFKKGDEAALFIVISTWSTYIQANRENWSDVADVAKVAALTRKLLELDEGYYFGMGHLILGVLNSILPPALGGKPDVAKQHFERAIELSDGKFLQAHVFYASNYARLVFDRPLHDRLLKHVLETPVDVVPELTLMNAMAKRQAKRLLEDADDYFFE